MKVPPFDDKRGFVLLGVASQNRIGGEHSITKGASNVNEEPKKAR